MNLLDTKKWMAAAVLLTSVSEVTPVKSLSLKKCAT